MCTKLVKWCVIGVVGSGLVGGLLLGSDMVSYVRSSAKGVRMAVKDKVPVEFDLRRARDMLEDIIPEMHANIRLIAQEEVEIAALKTEIARSEESIEDERAKLKTLRTALAAQNAAYNFGGIRYSRDEVKADLAARFERIREGEVVLASRHKLLVAREKSLGAAMQLLDRTRSQKQLLENKIEALESQNRLVRAAAVGSRIQVDNSKLAQTEKLIGEIKKRLDMAERVLAHESKFVESIPVDTVAEADLLAQVDDYFEGEDQVTTVVSVLVETDRQ